MSDSRANEIRAQAFLVGAKSDDRNDFLTFALPYTLFGLGILGAVVVIVLAVIFIVLGVVAALGIAEYGRIQRAERRALSQAQPIVLNIQIFSPSRQTYKALSSFVIDQSS